MIHDYVHVTNFLLICASHVASPPTTCTWITNDNSPLLATALAGDVAPSLPSLAVTSLGTTNDVSGGGGDG